MVNFSNKYFYINDFTQKQGAYDKNTIHFSNFSYMAHKNLCISLEYI